MIVCGYAPNRLLGSNTDVNSIWRLVKRNSLVAFIVFWFLMAGWVESLCTLLARRSGVALLLLRKGSQDLDENQYEC